MFDLKITKKRKYHNNRYSNGKYRKGKKPVYYQDMIAGIERKLKFQRLVVDTFYCAFVLLVMFGLMRGAGEFASSLQQPELVRAVIGEAVELEEKKEEADIVLASSSFTTPAPSAQVIKVVSNEDPRALKLYNYLKSKGSPLADQSAYMLQLADEFDLPWTLMPAIAGKESSYGKNVRAGSYNPFGLGGVDNYMYFGSWEEAILYEAKLLSNHYRFNMNKGIQKKYCPTVECDRDWAEHVTEFQQSILIQQTK